MKTGYNYSIVTIYQPKYYIPYANITFNGMGEFILLILIGVSLVSTAILIGITLKFALFGFILLLIIAIITTLFIAYFFRKKNGETGNSELIEFYYRNIKKYTLLITSKGERRFIAKKIKVRRKYVICRKI